VVSLQFPMSVVTIHDPKLLGVLDKVVPLCASSRTLDRRRLKKVDDVMDCVSLARLQEVMSLGDKHRAESDVSKCKIKLGDLEEELVAVAKDTCNDLGLMGNQNRLHLSGNGFYPKNSYMGWHTNRNMAGVRLYCNWARETGKSGLCYYHEGFDTARKVSLDCAGWNFRLFKTDYKFPFWHSVFSLTNRISVGFRIC